MPKKKKKPLSADMLIHRIMNNYFASKWCMYPEEVKTIETHIKTGMVKDKAVIKKLESLGFDCDA